MIVKDCIYGIHEVTEPVLLELMASPDFNRLRGISQKGLDESYTRFDHSVGTMLLLRILGASLEEQVAGLTHDVSHTAFSHLIDRIRGSANADNFQDENQALFIRNRTNFVSIVKGHGLPEKCVLEPHHYSLLEQPIPGLCADRVDYTLRDCAARGMRSVVAVCALALTTHEGKIVFNARYPAELFWKAYCDKEAREGSPEFVAPYELLADAFRRAFAIGAMSVEEMYVTDSEALGSLRKIDDLHVQDKLRLFEKGVSAELSDNADYVVCKKPRYVNPAFLEEGRLWRVSDVQLDYEDELRKVHARQAIPIRIVT